MDYDFLVLLQIIPILFMIPERFYASPGQPWINAPLAVNWYFSPLKLLVSFGLYASLNAGIQYFYDSRLPGLNLQLLMGLPPLAGMVAFYLVMDLFNYGFHRATHRVRVLWHFHAVHHSSRALSPFVTHRAHFVEEILYRGLRVGVLGIVGSHMVGGSPAAWTWFIIGDFLWAYFIHSDIKTNLGPLKYILATPQYHRIHHSIEERHFDKNFGGRLIVWDYLFGTMYPSFNEYPDVGIVGYPVEEKSLAPWHIVAYWFGHFLYPFTQLWLGRTERPEAPAAPVEANVG